MLVCLIQCLLQFPQSRVWCEKHSKSSRVCLFTILAAIIAATELAVLATKASAFAPRLRDEPWFMLLLHACIAGGTIADAFAVRCGHKLSPKVGLVGEVDRE